MAKNFKRDFSGYMFAALFAAVVGIMAYFGWIPWADLFLKYAQMRVSSVFKDANVFGPFLIPAVCMDYTCLKINGILSQKLFVLSPSLF